MMVIEKVENEKCEDMDMNAKMNNVSEGKRRQWGKL